MSRRRKPYTETGIGRMICSKDGCGKRAKFQWQICADGNIYRPICPQCDVAINEMVTRFMWGQKRESGLKAYREKALAG